MKYKKGQYTLIKFSNIGMKKGTKTFENYLTAKHASDKYLKNKPGCSTVISRVLFNSAVDTDKWST